MEAVLLVGIQAAGKSTFYRERFFTTHVRISLDLLRTRHRERSLLAWCLSHGQRFVVDNTNVTAAGRARASPSLATDGRRFESPPPLSLHKRYAKGSTNW